MDTNTSVPRSINDIVAIIWLQNLFIRLLWSHTRSLLYHRHRTTERIFRWRFVWYPWTLFSGCRDSDLKWHEAWRPHRKKKLLHTSRHFIAESHEGIFSTMIAPPIGQGIGNLVWHRETDSRETVWRLGDRKNLVFGGRNRLSSCFPDEQGSNQLEKKATHIRRYWNEPCILSRIIRNSIPVS